MKRKQKNAEQLYRSFVVNLLGCATEMDYLENRSRRNNFVIYGLQESEQKPGAIEQLVTRGMFFEMFGIEVKSIERVHRIGLKKPKRGKPVIRRFYDFTETILVLRNCHKLSTVVPIYEDYPESVLETLKKLWQASAWN